MNIDLKLAWAVLVSIFTVVAAVASFIAVRSRREGVGEEVTRQVGDRLSKAESNIKKQDADITKNETLFAASEEAAKALVERVEKVEGGVTSHDRSIADLRQELAKMPTRQELQLLHTELGTVRSGVAEVSGQLRGLARSLDLINEYLINRKDK